MWDLQRGPHATSISWKMVKIAYDKTVVECAVALEAHALTAALRRHIDDGVVIDTKVHLVVDDPGETHRHGFILGDVASTPTRVSVVVIDEVEGLEKVRSIQRPVELVS